MSLWSTGYVLLDFLMCLKSDKMFVVPPGSPPVASSSSEEEERSELDYADDPPTPRVEGTAQGTGCKVFMRLSVTNFSCDRLGWYSERVPNSSPDAGVWFECVGSITR